jgi:integrase-like protein
MESILLSCNHALRVSEVTALTASNVRDGYLCFDRLKGSQSSVHQLFPSEREAIEHLARTKPVGRLFPISRIQVGRLMKKYCRLAGIPQHKSHDHVLKHSTCMNMLDGGGQINEVHAPTKTRPRPFSIFSRKRFLRCERRLAARFFCRCSAQ